MCQQKSNSTPNNIAQKTPSMETNSSTPRIDSKSPRIDNQNNISNFYQTRSGRVVKPRKVTYPCLLFFVERDKKIYLYYYLPNNYFKSPAQHSDMLPLRNIYLSQQLHHQLNAVN